MGHLTDFYLLSGLRAFAARPADGEGTAGVRAALFRPLAGRWLIVALASLTLTLAATASSAVSGDVWGHIEWWGGIAIPAIALSAEFLLMGWKVSSLRRLCVSPSVSARSDLLYQALVLMGGMEMLVRLSACGLLAVVEGMSPGAVGWISLADLPIWLRLPLLLLAGNFVGYWEHRAMHSRWLWPLHKAHHSAKEFTIVNAFRGHPLEFGLQAITSTAFLALLGFSADDIALYVVVGSYAAAFVHSNLTRLDWLQHLGVMTAGGHRMHHAVDPACHGRNFGDMLNIWDRLFGTYLATRPGVTEVEIGVEEQAGRHNTGNPLAEIAFQTKDWLAVLLREATRRAASISQ
ncbi:MAG: sterol desaturase family protein [Alphaproteobacteria bacterium]|nr:sterol desaturase family protein [Alphaproteobacteria bacterium]MBV8406190.1 sterol desaturase family protein [Alphaproteobacteria bacterium]